MLEISGFLLEGKDPFSGSLHILVRGLLPTVNNHTAHVALQSKPSCATVWNTHEHYSVPRDCVNGKEVNRSYFLFQQETVFDQTRVSQSLRQPKKEWPWEELWSNAVQPSKTPVIKEELMQQIQAYDRGIKEKAD